MRIQDKQEGDCLVCMLSGEVNIDSAPELRKEFDKIIANDTKKVVLNFADISYIDSSGLATMIEMLQRLKKIGGKLRLCNISDRIRSIFEITKLEKLFEMFASEEEALKDF